MNLNNSFSTLVIAIAIITFLSGQNGVVAAKKDVPNPTYLFQMKGTALAEMRPILFDLTQEIHAPCIDFPLHDLVGGDVVGMGRNCLHLKVTDDHDTCDDGVEVITATTFTLDMGSMAFQTFASVPNATGAISQDGVSRIASGDGIYENASGSVRVSGVINIANLERTGEVTFDFLWVVYLDTPIDDLMGDETEMVVSQAVKATTENDNSDATQRLVLQMKGTAAAELRAAAHLLDEYHMLPCFDVPLVDLITGQTVGMGTDCLLVAGPDDCGRLQITSTAHFQFDGDNSLTATGITASAQRARVTNTFDLPDTKYGPPDIPSTGEGSIEGGTGIYADATGSVRLYGSVNISNLESKGEATFDCLWVANTTKEDGGSGEPTTRSAAYMLMMISLGVIAIVAAFFLFPYS